MTTKSTPALVPDTKSFRGSFLLLRRGGAKPRHRHASFGSAETEAQRLLSLHPDSTVVILQEVARVKMKPIDPDAATGCADDQTFAATSAETLRHAAGAVGSR